LFVLVTALACWLGYQANWVRQRHDALRMLPDGITYWQGSETAPPLSLRLLGEQGVTEFSEPFGDDSIAETDRSKLQHLFPEALWPGPPPVPTGEWLVPW
jgi:hypothetical protein